MSDFTKAVHQYFDDIALRHDLKCIISNEVIVRFQNHQVFLQVRYDADRSFEVGVEIGQTENSINQVERPFNLAEILRLRGSKESSYVNQLQADAPALLFQALSRLSILVSSYMNDLLYGRMEAFEELAKFREKEGQEYAFARDLKYARYNAEKAWENKDYAEVVKLYKPFNDNLDSSERMRLAYSERQIKNN